MRKRTLFFAGISILLSLLSCSPEFTPGLYNGRKILGARVVGIGTRCDGSEKNESGDLIYQTNIDLGDTTATLSVFISEMDENFAGYVGTRVAETTNETLKDVNFAMTVFDPDGNVYESPAADFDDPSRRKMEKLSLSLSESSGKWEFEDEYFWPQENNPLTFCSCAPDTILTGKTPAIKSLWVEDGPDKDGGKLMKLRYSQPDHFSTNEDAEKEHDLLVALTEQNKGTDGSVSVRFKHALTGVRFRCGDLHGVSVTGISLEGFAGSGEMTYDSKKDSVSWAPDYSDIRNFSQTFNDANDSNGKSALQKGDPMDITADKSKTFMMIPQTLPDDATISLAIGGNIHAAKVRISDLSRDNVGGGSDAFKDENIYRIKHWEHYAGKIITFQVSLNSNVNTVNVSLNDQISPDGTTKQNIIIRNDGTTPILVRMTMVGNWTNAKDQILSSWNERNPFGTFHSNTTGKDVDFTKGDWGDYWKEGTEPGIYYYKHCIMPGQNLKHNLFDTFKVTGKPESNQKGEWEGHVEMEIDHLELVLLVQAVSAVKTAEDGTWVDQQTEYILDKAVEAWGEFPFTYIGDHPTKDE